MGSTNILCMVDDKCKEFVNETRRLIAKKLDHMPNAHIFVISLSVGKTFLATHLFDENGNDPVELLKGEYLKQIQDKFYKLNSPNVCNLVPFFNHHSGRGYIDNIFELKSKNCYDYIKKCYFP